MGMSEYPPFRVKIGPQIEKERKGLGLTQNQFADRLNQYIANNKLDAKPVSYATISRWESNLSEPKSETVSALALMLGVDEAYLRGYQKERVSSESYAMSLLKKLPRETDEQKNLAVTLETIFDELFAEISDLKDEDEYLEHRINTINDPETDEDPY